LNNELLQADRYYHVIFDETNFICKNMEAGKSMDHIRRGYRVSKVKSHLIFYRVSNNVVVIIRVWHERMDIENHFSE
jgi:toxin ParE1/3/4